jgi:hypothetical protein
MDVEMISIYYTIYNNIYNIFLIATAEFSASDRLQREVATGCFSGQHDCLKKSSGNILEVVDICRF